MMAAPSLPTASASSASARSPMTGFFGVRENVQHRCVVEGDADGAQFSRQSGGKSRRKPFVTAASRASPSAATP